MAPPTRPTRASNVGRLNRELDRRPTIAGATSTPAFQYRASAPESPDAASSRPVAPPQSTAPDQTRSTTNLDPDSTTTTTYDNVYFRQSQGRMIVSDRGVVFEPYTPTSPLLSSSSRDAMTVPWSVVTQKSFSPPEFYAASIHFFQLETKPNAEGVQSSHAQSTDRAVIFQMANPIDLQRLEQDLQVREEGQWKQDGAAFPFMQQQQQQQQPETTTTNSNNNDQAKSEEDHEEEEGVDDDDKEQQPEHANMSPPTASHTLKATPAIGAAATAASLVPIPTMDETNGWSVEDDVTTALIPRDDNTGAAVAVTPSSSSPWALTTPMIDTTVPDSTYHPVYYKDQCGKLELTPHGFYFTPDDPGLLLHKKYHFKLTWQAMGNPEYSPYNYPQALIHFSYLAAAPYNPQNITSKRAGFELCSYEELQRLQKDVEARRRPWEGYYQDALRRASNTNADDYNSAAESPVSVPRKLLSMFMSLVRPAIQAEPVHANSSAAAKALDTIPEDRDVHQPYKPRASGCNVHDDDEEVSETVFSETSDDYYYSQHYSHYDDVFKKANQKNRKDDPWRVSCLFCSICCGFMVLWLITSAVLGYFFADDDYPEMTSVLSTYTFPPKASRASPAPVGSMLQNSATTTLPLGLVEQQPPKAASPPRQQPKWASGKVAFTKAPQEPAAAWSSQPVVLTKSPSESQRETAAPFEPGDAPPFLALLVARSFDSGVAVRLEGTPQYQAHAMMEAEYGLNEVDNVDQALSKFALTTLYFSTSGNMWLDATQWTEPGNELCTWHGVVCDEKSLQNVVGLVLHDNNLQGTIPNELAYLTGLKDVDLHSNSMTGLIPTTLGLLTDLETFDISHNQLSGVFPQAVIDLPSLDTLIAYPNANLVMP